MPAKDFELPPLFAGSLNLWQYQPMMKIEDYLAMMDNEFVHPLEEMKEKLMISSSLKSVEQLSKVELKLFVKKRVKLL